MRVAVKTIYGRVLIDDVLIDVENMLEPGIDILINGKFAFNKLGFTSIKFKKRDITKKDVALLIEWIEEYNKNRDTSQDKPKKDVAKEKLYKDVYDYFTTHDDNGTGDIANRFGITYSKANIILEFYLSKTKNYMG